jgi:hypothetical protein
LIKILGQAGEVKALFFARITAENLELSKATGKRTQVKIMMAAVCLQACCGEQTVFLSIA